MKYRAGDFFLVVSFRFAVRNLGIRAAFTLDRTLIRQTVRLILATFDASERLESLVVAWDAMWRQHDPEWITRATTRRSRRRR
jgi:hypothetical protein